MAPSPTSRGTLTISPAVLNVCMETSVVTVLKSALKNSRATFSSTRARPSVMSRPLVAAWASPLKRPRARSPRGGQVRPHDPGVRLGDALRIEEAELAALDLHNHRRRVRILPGLVEAQGLVGQEHRLVVHVGD